MKRIALFIFRISLLAPALAQEADPVVMRIAGQPVTRSELEYNYNKNNTENVIDRKDLEAYVPLFVNYKLKVRAAQDAGLDTARAYQDEFRQYRDQQIRPLLLPQGAEEREVRAYYDGMVGRLGGRDLRLPAHILLRLPQDATAEQQARAGQRIDSIAQALRDGADFAELARRLSDDRQSAQRGGLLTWYGPGQLVPEFEKVMYELEKGQTSQPFLSPVGYHIVRLADRKPLEPYDTLRPRIQQFLESRGMADRLARQAADSLAAERGLTLEQLMDRETERLTAQDTELKYLVQEYHDGLLLYEISKQHVWDPAARDTAALQQYFRQNRKRYAWALQDTAAADPTLQKDHRRFYGMAYYCRQPQDVKGVRKLLRSLPEAQWTAAVRDRYNKDSVTVRMEQPRLYRRGENACVDSLVFRAPGAKPRQRKGFPHAGTVGRLLKKGPQRWTDIGSQVVADYQKQCDDRFAEELRRKYPVEIYPEVLATVNRHD